jgi:hypothetical protein
MRRFKNFLQKARSNGEQGQEAQKPIQIDEGRPQPQPPQQSAPQEQIPAHIQASSATLSIALQNQTTSSTVFAYITGQALDNGNALFLLSADGKTPFYPSSPGETGSSIPQDCAIPLGAPGNTVVSFPVPRILCAQH